MESTPSNAFYAKALQKSFSRIFDDSSKKRHSFLIPVLPSLPPKIDTSFVQSHTLTPSPYFKDEYVTLDGKTVAIKGTEVTCKEGFRYPRSVQVLGRETCYNDNFDSYQLILVSCPLVGEIRNTPYSITSLKTKDRLAIARRRITDHKKFIASHLDSKCVPLYTGALQLFIEHFRQNYVIVKGFVDDAAKKCNEKCKSALEKVFRERNIDRAYYLELLVATECLVLFSLHGKIFKGICTLHTEEDTMLAAFTHKFRNENPKTELGVRKDLKFTPDRAVARLQELNSRGCAHPLAKLCCLYDTQEAISSGIEGGEVLAADDMLPLFAYVIVLSGDQSWYSNLEYLRHFSPESKALSAIDAGKLGYQLASYQAAVDLLRGLAADQKKAADLPPPEQQPSPSSPASGHERTSTTSDTEQQRRSSIRQGGSSARSRALRRMQRRQMEMRKKDQAKKSARGSHRYALADVDKALFFSVNSLSLSSSALCHSYLEFISYLCLFCL
ncbi:hypothetical protein AAMO2058_001284000 [Amorphochlora amoebiformis]